MYSLFKYECVSLSGTNSSYSISKGKWSLSPVSIKVRSLVKQKMLEEQSAKLMILFPDLENRVGLPSLRIEILLLLKN